MGIKDRIKLKSFSLFILEVILAGIFFHSILRNSIFIAIFSGLLLVILLYIRWIYKKKRKRRKKKIVTSS
ncbi:MAG: hypothetical protein ABIH55_00625 [Nanoarchaeota archaeon]